MDAAILRSVRDRAANLSEYCRLPQFFPGLTFHVEHIRARQHTGSDEMQNLALACPECNLRKGPNLTGVDPQDGSVVPLFNPRTQIWSEHFKWLYLEIKGMSSVGRTTTSLLQFNTAERLRVRELLVRTGYRFQN
jgi:hypothetical protein